MQFNLARKWRSVSFERIIGQDLAVRILKNSLFLGKFFPVYLLAGQHGCGKTTTARVFAAALNCALLPDFQLDHTKSVPCGTCDSCRAMQDGKHPDFIEIDAASHTGVDDVRQLLETASLMPLIGRKKIYLIDEAHMLSKSAFNAFLKMLEEPCDHVLFMLATTDEHKIIDTVKSRCFQLFFHAVAPHILKDHVAMVCQHEQMVYDDAGLELIVKQSHGSVRDALTLLEQVFLSEHAAHKNAVLYVLGAAADEVVIELVSGVLRAPSIPVLMQTIERVALENYNAEHIWRQLTEVLHALLWLEYGCQKPSYAQYSAALQELVKQVPCQCVLQLFAWWCQEEAVFLRTIHKVAFLQFFLVRAWIHVHVPNGQLQNIELSADEPSISSVGAVRVSPALQPDIPVPFKPAHEPEMWRQFIQALQQLQEPLVLSIFKQARVNMHDDKKVTIMFAQRLIFLKDTLEQTKSRWLPVFEQYFGAGVQLEYQFVAQETLDLKKKAVCAVTSVISAPVPMRAMAHKRVDDAILDVSDKKHWPKANTLLEYFPGTITSIVEPRVESDEKKQGMGENDDKS